MKAVIGERACYLIVDIARTLGAQIRGISRPTWCSDGARMFGTGRARAGRNQHGEPGSGEPITLPVACSAWTSRNKKPSAWTKGLQNSTSYEILYLVGKVGYPSSYGSEG